jgi:hypothetical protein
MTETSTLPVRTPTVYTLLALVTVTDSSGVESRYERELTFTVTHHEHFRDDTVDVVVENPRRPQDTFDFRAHQRQGLAGVLAEIHDYMSEQERRAYADGDTIRQRAARMAEQA